MKFLDWLFQSKFDLLQLIVIVVIVSVINEVIRIRTGACYNRDHRDCAYLMISPKTNVETNRVSVSRDERIAELEKKVANQGVCYPVYVTTKDEQELWRLRIERDCTTVNVWTNVTNEL